MLLYDTIQLCVSVQKPTSLTRHKTTRAQLLLTVPVLEQNILGEAILPEIEVQKAPSGVGYGEGVSPPHPTRGLGERREVLSGVRGGAPAGKWKRILAYFEGQRTPHIYTLL